MTKPSRSRSQGRDAFSGSSLRVDSARMAQNPPSASGDITLSEPPAIIASASPHCTWRKASPTACSPVVQAVAGAVLGPRAP